jgi:hypothetical protein
MQTEYNKPAGFDKARGKEIGKKNFDLSTMEEAFTSEHWIVRIYKVTPTYSPTYSPAYSPTLTYPPTYSPTYLLTHLGKEASNS